MAQPIVVADPDELDLSGTILSIGNFDGIHFGHRKLLERMASIAAERQAPSVVISFFPPSKVVFGGGEFLSSVEEKLELLTPFSPTAVAVIPFSREYAQTDKQIFLDQLARLEPAVIVVGEDFRFGHGRQGGLEDLRRVTPELEVFGLESLGGEVVKSSAIRELLAAGEVAAAARLLGGEYLVMGEALPDPGGDGLTVNVSPAKALPPGVFAVRVEDGADDWGAVACVDPALRGRFTLLPLDGPPAPASGSLRVRFAARLDAATGEAAGHRDEARRILGG